MHAPNNTIRLQEFPLSVDGQPIRSFPVHRPCRSQPPRRRGYDIREARTAHQHGVADMLVRQMYSWRGYSTESAGHRLDDPNRVTLSAWKGDEVVATLTLGRDSPAGLLADLLYTQELASLRRPGRTVCEVTRLAVDPDSSSRDLLTKLFQAGYKYAKSIFAAHDCVIEVNPRHARYYQRLLGFQQIGNLRRCPRVDAPAVLLHQTLDSIVIPTESARLEECTNCDFRRLYPDCV